MAATILELYDVLRKNLGEEHAANLVSFLNLHSKRSREEDTQIFASKIDLTEVKSELKKDISDLRTELKLDISELRTELKQDISALRTDVTRNIGESKTDVIRWMFTLFITIVLAFIGLYLKK